MPLTVTVPLVGCVTTEYVNGSLFASVAESVTEAVASSLPEPFTFVATGAEFEDAVEGVPRKIPLPCVAATILPSDGRESIQDEGVLPTNLK